MSCTRAMCSCQFTSSLTIGPLFVHTNQRIYLGIKTAGEINVQKKRKKHSEWTLVFTLDRIVKIMFDNRAWCLHPTF